MTARKDLWTREQHIVALNLYCKLGFTNVKYTNPKVEELAAVIGRTPSAVAYKLVNFARLDPELQRRGVKGMSHGSSGEEPVWIEFHNDFAKLAEVSEELLAQFKQVPLEVSAEIDVSDLPPGKERLATVKIRVNQKFFRDMVVALYKNRCCITGINNPKLLVAGHIMPWAKDEKNRMNPVNGVSMNALHDKAFDAGLISITPDYKVQISSVLKKEKKIESVQEYFLRYEGQSIILPHKHLPDKDFLDKHYSERFIR